MTYNSSGLLRKVDGGPAFVMAGFKRSTENPTEQGKSGQYWSSTAENSSVAYLLSLLINSYSSVNQYFKSTGYTLRCLNAQ